MTNTARNLRDTFVLMLSIKIIISINTKTLKDIPVQHLLPD